MKSQCAFILGRNPALSVAEIRAVLPGAKVVVQTSSFLILQTDDTLDGPAFLDRLGGTIKVGTVIGEKVDPQVIVDALKANAQPGKLRFGISFYECPATKLGMAVKQQLKEAGISSRLVTSRDKALSSVVVTKNKVTEFLVLENKWLAKTEAVQAFEDYSRRDYGRPVRDTKSGTLPPKLAQIMINLAQQPAAATILDPFCGSGTIIQEALLLGYANIIASDQSAKAVADTKQNLEWLGQKWQTANGKLFQCDVRGLGNKVKDVDAVITEPYLGPALRGHETRQQISRTVAELEQLYIAAFETFAKVVRPGGRVVIVFPFFKTFDLKLNIAAQIKKLGFAQLDRGDLIYSRPDQHVWRQVCIFSR